MKTYIIYASRGTSDECWTFCNEDELDDLFLEWSSDPTIDVKYKELTDFTEEMLNVNSLEEILD